MVLRNRLAVAALLSTVVACAATRPVSKATAGRPDDVPGLLVLVRAATATPVRARMVLQSASAVATDESRVPLRLVDPVLDPGESDPPRVHLTGAIPRGPYRGIELAFRSAERLGAGAPEPLEVPTEPLLVDAPFETTEGAAVVLVAEPRAIVEEGTPGRFAPRFAVGPPAKVASGLLGVATVRAWSASALFDKRTGHLVGVLPVGEDPAGVALDATRQRGYVAVSGGDAVAVLDLLAQRARERVTLRAGDAPRDVALASDGRLLLVANAGSDTVSFVDPLAAVELERVAIGGGPGSILAASNGTRSFVTLERGNAVAVLNVATRSVVRSIPVEGAPFQARFGGRNEETILVAHHESPYLTLIDSASLAVRQRVYVGTGVRAIEVDRRSGKVFVARAGTGRIEVFDGASLLPVDEMPIAGDVVWLAIEKERNALGVLVRDTAEVRIFGILGGGIMARAPLGADPFALRFLEVR